MNKIISYVSLGFSVLALVLVFLAGHSVSLGGASCSGVSACTAFPGTLRIDQLQVGNGNIANQINLIVTATSTVQVGTTTAIVLGPISATTSTATSTLNITVGIPSNGLAVGDICFANTNVTSTNSFGVDCTLTSVATTTASATVTYWNGASSAFTVPTSSIVRLEIHHLAY